MYDSRIIIFAYGMYRQDEILKCISDEGMIEDEWIEQNDINQYLKESFKNQYVFKHKNIKIAVAGVSSRVDTTTTAFNIARFLFEIGAKVSYTEANSNEHLKEITACYEFLKVENYYKYRGIEYYPNKQFPNEYNFNVFDLGNLNKGSAAIFKSCDIKVLSQRPPGVVNKLTIIEALLSTDSILYVLDPKNADLADLKTVMPNVYYKKDDMISCINNFYDEMMKRSETMKAMSNYKIGENYAYLGLPANFLIFDEYVAFMEMLGTKENTAVLNKLKQIVMLGRQVGFFLILACQRPDAKYLGDGIREQFNFRVALGRMSELGNNMMFGESNKEFFLKQIKGRGYVDVGTNVISEFYTPLVPKGHDFLKEIDKIIKSGQVEQSACEAKADCLN
ncbi:hypothetical protein K144313037_17460 [Clostridium tetani]|nr:hypothetical protein [Clostridium tetani]BDR70334.1 hypothetical protein K144313037_17460 [Clostridium tetani]BDR84408.1 hypothetical protein K254310026_18190 [Clostridium tetani]BEV19972.1 hypothetical protein K154301001_18270 [Clostridium tetani]